MAEAAIVRLAQHFPELAENFGKALAAAVQNPGEVGKGFVRLLSGIADYFNGVESENREYAGRVWDWAMKRYGSIENIANTIITDPAGFLGDVSTIFTLGGIVAWGPAKAGMATARMLPAGSRAARNVGAAAGVAEKVTNTAFKVGSAADPLYLPGKAVSKTVQSLNIPGRAGPSLAERAQKFVRGASTAGSRARWCSHEIA